MKREWVMWKRNQNPARKIMTSKYERVTEGREGETEKPLWTSKSRSDCKKMFQNPMKT